MQLEFRVCNEQPFLEADKLRQFSEKANKLRAVRGLFREQHFVIFANYSQTNFDKKKL